MKKDNMTEKQYMEYLKNCERKNAKMRVIIEERRKREREHLDRVVEKYWLEQLTEEYFSTIMYKFIKKYSVKKHACMALFGSKMKHPTKAYHTESPKKYPTTDEREKFLAEMWEKNKLINEQFNYAPVYTHKSAIPMPFVQIKEHSPAQEYLNKRHATATWWTVPIGA